MSFPKFISLNAQNTEGEKLEIKFKMKESEAPGQSKTEKKPKEKMMWGMEEIQDQDKKDEQVIFNQMKKEKATKSNQEISQDLIYGTKKNLKKKL